jgi:hypothetical protein
MESKMASLHIDMPPRAKTETSKKKQTVVESWEDEDTNSPLDEGSNAQTPTDVSDSSFNPAKRINSALAPPPPTPISSEHNGHGIDWSTARVLGGGRPTYSPSNPSTPSDSDRERRRPEKSTATASRLIAAGLGMKVPKKTEETRQYERAIREQEIRRKNREKEAQEREREADEKLKAAVWDS